jgi:hypothetical protein
MIFSKPIPSVPHQLSLRRCAQTVQRNILRATPADPTIQQYGRMRSLGVARVISVATTTLSPGLTSSTRAGVSIVTLVDIPLRLVTNKRGSSRLYHREGRSKVLLLYGDSFRCILQIDLPFVIKTALPFMSLRRKNLKLCRPEQFLIRKSILAWVSAHAYKPFSRRA